MKPVLSVLIVFFLVIVAVQCSLSHIARINKRYYDAWEPNSDGSNNGDLDLDRAGSGRNKGSNRNDPCDNKPLWFLKSQARLGKLSPFYDCLANHGLEKK